MELIKSGSEEEPARLSVGELRILMAKALDVAWKEYCANPDGMVQSFRSVGLSLKIDGSEDSDMDFQGQPKGKPVGLHI